MYVRYPALRSMLKFVYVLMGHMAYCMNKLLTYLLYTLTASENIIGIGEVKRGISRLEVSHFSGSC